MSKSEVVRKNVNSKRPSISAFKQQRLPAWRPVLTARTVLPSFFIIGVVFIPVGITLLVLSNNVNEKIIDYTTECTHKDSNLTCADWLNKTGPAATCECNMTFILDVDFIGEVYMYYRLSNYYQNHREYVISRDDCQLFGYLNEDGSARDCYPFDKDGDKIIFPCGAVADSLFNDTLELYCDNHHDDKQVPLLNQGIAFPSDKRKFKNPGGNWSQILDENGYVKPRSWSKQLWQLDENDEENNGLQNEDLIVWMRTAALSDFRKLYRRIDHSKDYYSNGLPKGNYTLAVKYRYPVTAFDGRKQVILSTTSVLGGKNPFLGIAYLVVGCAYFVFSVVLLVIYVKYGKITTELMNVKSPTPHRAHKFRDNTSHTQCQDLVEFYFSSV